MGKRVAIHANPALKHQRDYAEALAAGFRRHGLNAAATDLRRTGADLHVCIGPWYALRENAGERLIYADRAYWGDPECVSLHWYDGGKVFDWSPSDRPRPRMAEMKGPGTTVYICDFSETPPSGFDEVRCHPAWHPNRESLSAVLERHSRAVGGVSTAMVEAALQGLSVDTSSERSPVYPLAQGVDRGLWLAGLSNHNWALSEIESGAAWELLRDKH